MVQSSNIQLDDRAIIIIIPRLKININISLRPYPVFRSMESFEVRRVNIRELRSRVLFPRVPRARAVNAFGSKCFLSAR